MNLSDIMNATSAFAGVNPGYQGDDVGITNPHDAVPHVAAAVKTVGLEAKIYPGRIVYGVDRGCPRGGEAIGAIFVKTAPDLTAQFDQVRQTLKQTTLSVITPQGSGIPTTGFVVDLGPGNLDDMALAWQTLAAAHAEKTNMYVSGGLYEAEGRVYAQAEANPAFIKDIPAWKENAVALLGQLQKDTKPVFRAVGFTYLRKVPV